MRAVILVAVLVIAASSIFAAEPKPDDFFGPTKVHQVQVTVTAADYAAMDPPPNANPFGPRPGGAPQPGRPAPGSPDFGAGTFGFEFKEVPGAIEVDGAAFPKVGVRYKGNGTYAMSSRQTKRSLKIDFDHLVAGQTLGGMKKLNLHSGVMDPTKAREVLAYGVFQTAGVPAPRTAIAEVALTVPSKLDREHLGVFTIVEQIDKAFLRKHFASDAGLLLKPEGIRGLPHFGQNPKDYEPTYQPKTDGDEAQWRRLIELTRLINGADDADFCEKIGDYLDLDAFARFLAVNTMLASMDGFLGMGHNYYLYLVPATKKFVFIPWDLDLAFGGFPFFGGQAQLADLSIDHPHLGSSKLIDRLLAMPEWKAEYRRKLEGLATGVFAREKLGQDVSAIETLLKPLLAREKTAAEARRESNALPGFFGAQLPLATFVERRAASVQEQLAGRSKGYVPVQGGFGPGGPGPGMGPGGGPGQVIARPLLMTLDTNQDGKLSEEEFLTGMKKLRAEWDKDGNGILEQRELAEGLQKFFPSPGPPGQPGPRP